MLIVQFKRCTDKYLKKTILKDGEIAINIDTNTLHFGDNKTLGGVPVVQLATAQDIKDGTANKVVDAKELINFAQTLPAANGITDVSSGDNSNQLVVSRIGGSKTLTIDNVEHADNADEATHATQADTATSANSVAWDNVSEKPSSYTPSSHTHDDRYYTESEINTKLSGKSDTTHNHNSAYLGITAKAESSKSADSVAWSNVSSRPTKVSQFTNDSGYITSSGTAATISQKVDSSAKTHTNYNTNGTYVPTMNFLSYWNGAYNSSGSSNLTYCAQGAIIGSNNIGSQSVNYAKSAGAVAWGNVSGKPSTFTPSSHTHTKSQITDFPTIPTVNNATLTIQKNSSNVATFTANASSNVTANITVPTKTSELTNNSGYITSSSNITGNASTATKLATARSISAGDLEFQGSANFDGSGNIKLNITQHRSIVSVSNTNNYPFHRIAYTAQETGSWIDRSITFFIGREYVTAGYGICRIVLRTNDAAKGATAQCEVQWLVRTSSISVDTIQVGFNNTAKASYVDVFYKSNGSYNSAICRVISHANSRASVGQGFAVVATSTEATSTTTSDPKTSVESYATIAAAGTKIRGKAYTSTITASDAGIANYATHNANGKELVNSIIKGLSVSGRTITYTKLDGTTGTLTTQDTTYSHPTSSGNKHIPSGGSNGQFLGWSADGTAKWVNNPNTNTWNALKGSTTSAAGTAGYAPAPAAGAANRYLRCDGTWQVPPDNNTTYSVATTSANGLMSSSDKTKLNKCVTTDSIWIG